MKVNDGSIELLKVIGVVCMTCDHVNKYLFNGTLPYLFEIGRLALPLFLFVLAYNLNRPNALTKAVFSRIALRLFIFAAIATVPYVLLGGVDEWYLPLNILFTLLIVACMAFALNSGRAIGFAVSFLLFLLGGAIVEYGWLAIAIGVTVWAAIRNKSYLLAIVAIISCAALHFINLNYFALLALPVIGFCLYFSPNIIRFKYFYYAYYPLHLFVLLLIRIPMGKAGYFFIGV